MKGRRGKEMNSFPLKNPEPEFSTMASVLKGETEAKKVHLVELMLDFEVMADLYESLFGKKWIPLTDAYSIGEVTKTLALGKGIMPMAGEKEQAFWKQYAEFFFRMGYDYVPDVAPAGYLMFLCMPRIRMADDTASLSRGKRMWTEEGKGIITSWQDFEKYNWDMLKLNLEAWCEFWEKNLPSGMKISVMGLLYEQVMERILGYEGLFFMLHDQPDLVEAVFNKWGQIMYDIYEQMVKCDAVGMIFHGDDMGYKTGTIIKPDDLRKYFFPWLKKYAELAHSHGKMFWLHSCGKVLAVMEDLIEDVKIDAFHSFQEEIIPVYEFKKRYGDRIGTLGGVDVDCLARMDEKNLREYCRKILDECMPTRYAFGSGNSITNYIPPQNYLIMMDEARKWKM
jgi:uroporphyrinogen decarboxylase